MAATGNVAAGLPNLGHTYHGGTPSSIGRSVDLEGTEAYFKDEVPQTGMAPALKRSGRTKVCRLVRNSSGISLLPKRAVKWESGYRGTRVDGYCAVTAAECAGIVDDQLPAGGVADDDLFWVVRKGPCLLLTDLAGGANNVFSDGTVVVALTAATSQATTAGRIAPQSLTGATAVLGGQIQNAIGKAMSAKTTANTNADILVDLEIIN
jgi:hypothetical protein